MKRILCFILLTATLLSAFCMTAFADDNAQSGTGDTHGPASGYAWYNGYQYLWKVTLYVGKSDQATKQSNLLADFYKIGTVIMKKNDWSVSSNVKFGSNTKVEYLAGSTFGMATAPTIISHSSCPKIPVVCGGDINTVKSFFGSTGTVLTVLNTVASDRGVTKEQMLSYLRFDIDGVKKTGWDYSYLAPDCVNNRVPWVIVYEPMVVLNLKDKVTQLAFTATEFALCELKGWYDWNMSGGSGQGCASLTEKHLPTSTQLEESWFGYPVYKTTDNSTKWNYNDVVKGGGWGMRWLPISGQESDMLDFSVSNLCVEPSEIYQGNSATVSFISDNWNPDVAYEDILVEVLVGNSVVKSVYTDYLAYGRNYHTYEIEMPDYGSKNISARINWADRFSETDASDNLVSTKVDIKRIYEFSVRPAITVSPATCYENGVVELSFTTDSWDEYNSYTDIPVEVLYNGKVIHTEYADYAPYGAKQHTVKINVGSSFGDNEIKVRVNWANHLSELNPNNNERTAGTVTVKPNIDLTIQPISPNSDYRAGMTVITSYRIINNSNEPITPNRNNTVSFEAYYYNGGTKVSVSKQTWKQAVIPSNEKNLVYFKWTVPKESVGRTMYCTATVNSDNTITESSTVNNIAVLTRIIANVKSSQTPDTQYEESKPDGFTVPSYPSTTSGRVSWTLWEYKNNAFVKRTYGMAVNAFDTKITPDKDSPSAENKYSYWTMKSGYGFTVECKPTIAGIMDHVMPSETAYTQVQFIAATFPEFAYSKANGSYRTLEKVGGTWSFVSNPNADGNERLHFIPLWYPDGNYSIHLTLSEVWTPSGMVTLEYNTNYVVITDSAYDDWYIGAR